MSEHGRERERVRRDAAAFGELPQERDVAARGEPAVRKRLLDDHAEPARVRFRKHRRGRALEQVPGRLHRVEDPDLERALDRLGLMRAGHRQADRQARLGQPSELFEHGSVVEDAALERGGVDLIEAKMRTEQAPTLGELPS